MVRSYFYVLGQPLKMCLVYKSIPRKKKGKTVIYSISLINKCIHKEIYPTSEIDF